MPWLSLGILVPHHVAAAAAAAATAGGVAHATARAHTHPALAWAAAGLAPGSAAAHALAHGVQEADARMQADLTSAWSHQSASGTHAQQASQSNQHAPTAADAIVRGVRDVKGSVTGSALGWGALVDQGGMYGGWYGGGGWEGGGARQGDFGCMEGAGWHQRDRGSSRG